MSNSSKVLAVRKPHPDFPLFPHATGRWAKKVRGKLIYFGKTADDPTGQAALDFWDEQKDALLAGRRQRPKNDGTATVADVVNGFLAAKNKKVASGELALRTLEQHLATGKLLAKELGRDRPVDDLGPDDFAELRCAMAERWGPGSLGNRIQSVRSMFKWAYESELIDAPIRFGPDFAKPSAKTLREARPEKGPRRFSAEQVVELLDNATPHMKAMVLLAINGGLGNGDVGNMPQDALDLENGWLNYARKKTAIHRRIPLWPQTVEGIKLALAVRPKALNAADAELVFIGPRGKNYRRGFRVSAEFLKAAKLVGVPGEFYSLRRTFQTVVENCGDFPAVAHIMGHAARAGDMASVYRQAISDERLRAVVESVRAWLWPKKAAKTKANSGSPKKPSRSAETALRVVG